MEVVGEAASGQEAVHLVQQLQVAGLAQLTNRELEVLRLIADGHSNAIIAELLVITEGTVKTHVTNILGKLQLADRTQAAALAWQQGVVDRVD
jgi:NarL family two-component system response regulator LiaR